MQIFLKDIDGRNIIYDIHPTDTVYNFKQQIQNKTAIPINFQTLVHHGKILQEDKLLTASYNILKNDTVHLRFKLLGKGNWFSAQVNQIKQTNVNEFYQRSEVICTAECENILSGNTIFLDGTTSGDIIFKQRCSAESTCMMRNAVDVIMELVQEFQQNNQTEAGLFPNFASVNLNLSDQEIRNEVEQILNTVCTADIQNIQNDNMVYARNSSTGDIIFEQEGNAQANCIMANVASADLNLRQTGDQQNSIRSAGLGGINGLVIVAIIIALIIGAVGRAKKSGRQSSGDQGDDQGPRRRSR